MTKQKAINMAVSIIADYLTEEHASYHFWRVCEVLQVVRIYNEYGEVIRELYYK